MKDTRKLITDTAMDLFKEKGYENTSVNDICKACKISKGTFYYHFPNKDELTYEFYEKIFSEFSEVLADLITISNAKDQLWAVYEYSIDRTIALTPQVLYALMLSDIQKGLTFFSPYGDHTLPTGGSRNLKLQIELVKKGQKEGNIRQGDPITLVRTFISALIGIAITWSSNDGPFDEKEELRKAFDIIF